MKTICVFDFSHIRSSCVGIAFFLRFLHKICGNFSIEIFTGRQQFISMSRFMDPRQIRYFLFSDSSEIQESARQIGIPYIFPLKKGNFYQLYTSIFWRIKQISA